MSRALEDLAPDFIDTARAVLRLLEGKPVMVYMTRRTTAEQAAFFAQGRKPLAQVNASRLLADLPPIAPGDNLVTLTNCDGIQYPSPHQSGRAIDIVAVDAHGNPSWDYAKYAEVYKAIRDAAIEAGADPGASWLKHRDGTPSPYAKWGLGWDPPHVQKRS